MPGWLVVAGLVLGAVLLDRQRRGSRRRNPLRLGGPKAARAALAASAEFHGANEVVALDAGERSLPKYVVALGYVPELTYAPRPSSARGDTVWTHESGDYGHYKWPGEKPLLCADPRTGKPLLVTGKSRMRFKADRGLVG